jgi:tetratricopeptide (TPR) repeat protein
MQFAIQCPQCQQRFAVAEQLYGASVPCPNCGNLLHIPHPPPRPRSQQPPPADWTDDFHRPAAAVHPAANRGSHPFRDQPAAATTPDEQRLIVLCCSIGGAVVFLLLAAIVVHGVMNRGERDAAAPIASGLPQETAAPVRPDAAASALDAVGELPDEDACRAFGLQFEAAIEAGDTALATRMIDWQAILEKATTGEGVPDRFRADFIRGAVRRANDGDFVRHVVQSVSAGRGHYSLVHVHDVGNQRRALFRFALHDSGITYHDFPLCSSPDGGLRAGDVYVMTTGEFMSETMRRMYLMAAGAVSSSFVDRLLGKEREMVRHFEQMQQISQHVRTGNYQQVVALYQQLPASLRQEKVLMLARIQATSQLDDQQYLQAIDDFQRVYPRDPSLQIILIDAYLLKQEFEQALQSVDRLDRSLGGDPYLDTIRAGIHIDAGNWSEDGRYAQRAVDAEMDFAEAYVQMAIVAVTQEDRTDAIGWLRELEARFPGQYDLSDIPELQPLLHAVEE